MLGRYCLPVGVVNTCPTVRSLIFSLGRSGRFCRRFVDRSPLARQVVVVGLVVLVLVAVVVVAAA